MTVLALMLAVAAFVATLKLLRAEETAGDAIRTARDAAAALRAPGLSDAEKEAASRRAAARLFRGFALIAGTGIVALAVPAALVWAGSAAGFYALDDAVATATSWPFILASTAVVVVAWVAVGRSGRREAGTTGVPYGRADRVLHRAAFATPGLQRALAENESRTHEARIDLGHAERPVLVTSLPRAGTTVLFEALAGLPEFGAATYRHMPFPLLPLLWTDASRRFQRSSELAERAHGDGVKVGFDSPEAFEEPVWMAFWADHYGDTIRPWTAEDRNARFEAFLRRHMAKVVASAGGGARRYVSKNNANIARLPLIAAAFPDASVVVPVREPWAQVASLLRQHRRFAALHAEDDFARRYMAGIGHFEFGAALRPIDFGASAEAVAGAEAPEFWLAYWADAYEAVLATAGDGVVFVDHDRLSAEPGPHLAALGEAIGVGDRLGLERAARRFRPSRPAAVPEAPKALLDRAAEIHAELAARCLGPVRETWGATG